MIETLKVQNDVEKQKTEYEKAVNKVIQDKAKYEDLKIKGNGILIMQYWVNK